MLYACIKNGPSYMCRRRKGRRGRKFRGPSYDDGRFSDADRTVKSQEASDKNNFPNGRSDTVYA